MSEEDLAPLTPEELAAEGVTALPDKEVISILDLAADVDLAIDGAAPIDLAVALNANVVAPIDAAVSANLLSDGSQAQAISTQGGSVTQSITADATAVGIQDSTIDQSDTTTDGTGTAPTDDTGGAGATLAAMDAAGAVDAATAAAEPVDGAVVVDSAGNILGTLDAATGNVYDGANNVVGTLNEASGLVLDSNGAILGTVTNLVDGAVVANATGDIIGVLNGLTGEVTNATGGVVGTLDPLTGEVLNTANEVLGTVTSLVDGATMVDSAGNVLGTLDATTGNILSSTGAIIGTVDPLTGQVLDAAGNVIGSLGPILDDVTDTLGGLNTGDLLKGDLLNVDVNVDLDADLAAPINGAVAANANVAAPIDASVAANILSDDSIAVAQADQSVNITQTVSGHADASSTQVSDIDQGSVEPPDTDTASTDGSDSSTTPVSGGEQATTGDGDERAHHGDHATVTTLVDAPTRVDDVQLWGRRWGPDTGPHRPWFVAATGRRSSSRPCCTRCWTRSTGGAAAPRSRPSSAAPCAGASRRRWCRRSSTSTCDPWGCSGWPTGPSRRSTGPTPCWDSSSSSRSPTPGSRAC